MKGILLSRLRSKWFLNNYHDMLQCISTPLLLKLNLVRRTWGEYEIMNSSKAILWFQQHKGSLNLCGSPKCAPSTNKCHDILTSIVFAISLQFWLLNTFIISKWYYLFCLANILKIQLVMSWNRSLQIWEVENLPLSTNVLST